MVGCVVGDGVSRHPEVGQLAHTHLESAVVVSWDTPLEKAVSSGRHLERTQVSWDSSLGSQSTPQMTPVAIPKMAVRTAYVIGTHRGMVGLVVSIIRYGGFFVCEDS